MLLPAIHQTLKNELLVIFLFLILIDFLTGYLKSVKWKVTSSDIGTKGVIKHTFTFIFYFVVVLFGYYFQSPYISNALLILVMLTYTTSIVENLGVMGVYVPSFIKNRVMVEIEKYTKMLGEEAPHEKE